MIFKINYHILYIVIFLFLILNIFYEKEIEVRIVKN